MFEKKFREPGEERTLQGSSGASPGKEKRSAGDRKQDKKWQEYQESLAAEAAPAAKNETKGGTPAPCPQQPNGGHQPRHTTLGDFLEVAKKAKAKPSQLHLRKSGPSSNVELAHRGRRPTDEASCSSSIAPDQRNMARACECACGVHCNLRVARQRATEQNAAVEGAVSNAQQEAAEWSRGMAFHASAVAGITTGVTAAAAKEAAAAPVRSEVELKALEEALARERARKEAEERAHAGATAKAQEDR